jgi:hypothetical protein
MTHRGWTGAALLATVEAGCGRDGTGFTGRLSVGPGILLVERGELHEGSFELGATIQDDGSYELELPGGGVWGLHVYVEGYYYLPVGLDLEEGHDHVVTQDDVDWDYCEMHTGQEPPSQPEDETVVAMLETSDTAGNPGIANASAIDAGEGTVRLSVDAWDPDGNLSEMVLVYFEATGLGTKLNPPGPSDLAGNYPDGTWTSTAYVGLDSDREAPVWFVAADQECLNSPIVAVSVQQEASGSGSDGA